jgi:hypothetical protein
MTTTVKIKSHNYPARVETFYGDKLINTVIVHAEDLEYVTYCSTSSELRITDLEYNDPVVLADREKKNYPINK